MTLREVSNQIYSLMVGGKANGERFTKETFYRACRAWLKGSEKSYIMEVTLPDGDWLCKVYEWKDGDFDYFLPDTREQEERLYKELGIVR